MPKFNYYELIVPQKWCAGTIGTGPDAKPFYFDCADCGEKEAVIAGYLATQPDFLHIAIMDKGPGDQRPALFCRTCLDQRLAANPDEGLCPICGAFVTLTGRTTDGRLIGSCRDAFTEERWMECHARQVTEEVMQNV